MTRRAKAHLAAQAEAVEAPLPDDQYAAQTAVAALTAAQPLPTVKTMSIPECGKLYFGLSRNGSYAAAKRGDIPIIQIGRLKRAVPSVLDARLAATGDMSPTPE